MPIHPISAITPYTSKATTIAIANTWVERWNACHRASVLKQFDKMNAAIMILEKDTPAAVQWITPVIVAGGCSA